MAQATWSRWKKFIRSRSMFLSSKSDLTGDICIGQSGALTSGAEIQKGIKNDHRNASIVY